MIGQKVTENTCVHGIYIVSMGPKLLSLVLAPKNATSSLDVVVVVVVETWRLGPWMW